MINTTAWVALSLAFLGSTGCAKEWTKPGASEQQLNADQLSCEQQAAKLYPVIHDPTLSYRPAASGKLDTSCVQQTGLSNCDAAGNAAGAPAAPAADANDYDRSAAVKACLASKGYVYRKARP
jgi:hypothetical protein